MANEDWAKRFLRSAGYWPKDTREPRGPEHMAKMKAARGPYSDPRDTYIARTIRYAFESSRGKPLSTGQLVKEIYGLAASCRAQAAGELALPECSQGVA
jgi:hypothetical protein